jgi:PAS domain S-box-containing protein
LRLSETEYRALVDHSPVLIWRAGLDAKCNYFNERWLAFTGRSLAEERGDGWATGVHPDDFQRCVEYYLDHFERREAFEMEYRLRRHDGVYRWIFDRGAPYADDAGAFAGFIGSCIDIDDRRRAQDAREGQGESALTAGHGFEQWVLGIVGHDIRNPLSAIFSANEQLVAKSTDSGVVQRNARRIARSAARIKHLVDDLLDLTRERRGGIPISVQDADVANICQNVIEEVVMTSVNATITFICRGSTTAICDPHRTAQAISNLVGNAVQHGLPNSPIAVSLVGDDRQLVFEIHNAGEIPAEKHATLFLAFQGQKPQSHTGGLGLGLYIANAIAKAHGGGISVTSSSVRGTVFSLSMPRFQALRAIC